MYCVVHVVLHFNMYQLTTHWRKRKMTEHIDKAVLMKCEGCQYEEYLPLEDYILLSKLEPLDPEVHMLCPFCLSDMYRADSDRLKK